MNPVEKLALVVWTIWNIRWVRAFHREVVLGVGPWWCEDHWETIWAEFMAGAIRSIHAPFFALAMQAMEIDFGGKRSPENLRTSLREHAPLCCHVGDDFIRYIVETGRDT